MALVTQVAQSGVQVGQEESFKYLPAGQDLQVYAEPSHVAHYEWHSTQVPSFSY